MPEFIPGLRLSELFYHDAIKPVLAESFPRLKYAAGLIGFGSDTLGFDTPLSRDHSWGPRLLLFLPDSEYDNLAGPVDTALRQKLPPSFYGYSTSFRKGDEEGVVVMEEEPDETQDVSHSSTGRSEGVTDGTYDKEVNHYVWLTSLSRFFEDYAGINPYNEVQVLDWLIIPQQILRSVTAGKVFHDATGDLTAIRQKLAYYPHDVWLLLLAAQWTRIAQEEPFMGRAAEAGDSIGSVTIAARLVRDVMFLCFLLERQYAPYVKWFGTGFLQLKCGNYLKPLLQKAIQSQAWLERESYLSQAYEFVARMHNSLGITRPIPAEVSNFYNRPYRVIHADIFARETAAAIQNEEVKQAILAGKNGIIGSIDQWADSTDILSNARIYNRLRCFYKSDAG